MGTAPLLALEGLSITQSGVKTVPNLNCLSRILALDLSGHFFEVRVLHCSAIRSLP